jgi:hypothetical protein
LTGTSDFAPLLPFQLKSAPALGDPAPVIPKAVGFSMLPISGMEVA